MKTASLVFEETMDNGSPDAGSHAAAAALNRARSNTWSVGCEPMMAMTMVEELREGDGGVVLTNLGSCSSVEADSSGTSPPDAPGGGCKDPVTTFRKNWTRRNAWGNLSYAELITKAIEGSPEKRLTLSQIYDWIVHNVDYFANKGDNSSSAGWKNSIRHNLSLHSRFVRLVNDGAGKSSWWSINPDAQPLKPSRRRAATLDSKTLRKRGGGGGGGGEPGAQRKVDFAGRSLEEVDSTTSGAGFSTSSILSPGNSRSQDDGVMAMDVGLNGSPSGYPREHGFAKAGSLSGTVPGDFRIAGHETGGAPPGSGSPPYGVRGGGSYRMDLLGGKGPGRDPGPELCFPNHEKPNGAHGKGRLNEGARVAHGKHRRNYVPTAPLEDRSISLGFCAGNGIFYDEVFDHPPPHPVQQPAGNGYFPKRYFDETPAGYATGLNYGGSCHGNVYYPPGDAYTGGFYGNGGCFNNRAFPDGRFTGEIGSLPVPVPGSREVSAGGHGNGQGLRSGGFPEVQDMEQNGGSRSKDASSSTGDENRELNAFPMGGYCSPSYIDMEGGKGAGAGVGGGGYSDDAGQGTIHRDDGGLQRNPSVSRFQDVEPKTETTLTDTSFFRALTTTSGYADDFPSIPDTPLRPISSPGVQSSNEPYYRSSIAAGSKYPYLSDPTAAVAKPFSQLLANRAGYPTCRNSNTVDGFYIPTTF